MHPPTTLPNENSSIPQEAAQKQRSNKNRKVILKNAQLRRIFTLMYYGGRGVVAPKSKRCAPEFLIEKLSKELQECYLHSEWRLSPKNQSI